MNYLSYNIFAALKTSIRGPSSILRVEDLKISPLQKGHKIKIECMGGSSNFWIVCNPNEILLYENELAKLLRRVEMFSKTPLDSSCLVKGQIVAALWSKDEKMYRAFITDINLNLGKVNVRFIDYGNQSIEPFKNLFVLPKLYGSKIPALAKLIDLDGVPIVKKSHHLENL